MDRIGGTHVEIQVLVGPGQSPATYEPTPKQMTEMARADVYFRIGLPFESRLLDKIQSIFTDLRIVDTRQGIRLYEGEHSHQGEATDPHIWLDPKLVITQATTICDELCRLDSINAQEYRKNLQSFKDDLNRADDRVAEILTPFRGRKLYVFHPSYGYFARAYGLIQTAFEFEGKEPTPRQLADLIEQARRDGVTAVFVQPQFSSKGAQAVARAIDARVVEMDPLARDYLSNLVTMAENIARSLP